MTHIHPLAHVDRMHARGVFVLFTVGGLLAADAEVAELRDWDVRFDAGVRLRTHTESSDVTDAEFAPSPARPSEEVVARMAARIERLMHEQRWEQARIEIELEDTATSPALSSLAAEIYFHVDQLDAARDHALHATTLDADHLDAWAIYGAALMRQGAFEEAQSALSQALTRWPYHPASIYWSAAMAVMTDAQESAFTPLKSLSAGNLRELIVWLARDRDTLLPWMGDERYAAFSALVLSGGERAAWPGAVTATSGQWTFSPTGEFPELLQHSVTASNWNAKLISQIPDIITLIDTHTELVSKQRWQEVADFRARATAARLAFTAPAFHSQALYAEARAGGQAALSAYQPSHPDHLYPALYSGISLLHEGKSEDAWLAFSELSHRFPRHAVIIWWAGHALLDAVPDRTPHDWVDRDELLVLHDTFLQRLDEQATRHAFTSARLLADRALQLFPESYALRFSAAQLANTDGALDQAANFLRELKASHPDNIDVLNQWAGVMLRLKEFDEARMALDHVLAHAPNLISARYNRALLAARDAHWEQAYALLKPRTLEEYGHALAWLAQEAPLLDQVIGTDAIRELAGYLWLVGTEEKDTTGRSRPERADFRDLSPEVLQAKIVTVTRALRVYLDATQSGDTARARNAWAEILSTGARPPESSGCP